MIVDSSAGPRDEDLFIRPDDQHSVMFGSLDAGRSVFVNGGAKQSLTGPLDRSGVVLMESTGFGLTPERASIQGMDMAVLRFTHQTSLLPGYQWNGDGVHVAAFAGPEVQQEQLTYGGRVYRWSQPRFGARGQLDLWLHPSPDTLVTNTLIVSSTRTSLWNRASVGYRAFGSAFVGPEVTVYATPNLSGGALGRPHHGLPALDRDPAAVGRLDGGRRPQARLALYRPQRLDAALTAAIRPARRASWNRDRPRAGPRRP